MNHFAIHLKLTRYKSPVLKFSKKKTFLLSKPKIFTFWPFTKKFTNSWSVVFHLPCLPHGQGENQPKILPRTLPKKHAFQVIPLKDILETEHSFPTPQASFFYPSNLCSQSIRLRFRTKSGRAKEFLLRERIGLGWWMITRGMRRKWGQCTKGGHSDPRQPCRWVSENATTIKRFFLTFPMLIMMKLG